MKHKAEITIDAPRDVVWKAFDNPDNMPKWQPTLKSFEHKSGTPGQPGAVSELVYDENGRKVVVIETVTERREPDFLAGTYESAWGKTVVVNNLVPVDDKTTRWTVWCNFQFRGVMKFLSLFIGGSIRKRTDDDLQRFKLLVESQVAGK